MIKDTVSLIKLHEGAVIKNGRHMPYKCSADKWTACYGRNIEDMGFSQDEADYLLQNDIARVRRELEARGIISGLDDVREAVAMDMCYNLGINRLLKFRKFISALRVKDFDRAAREMVDSKWYRQVGTRAKRLVKMMKTGEWPK
ncbi:glycoside hydrolase family protein [Litorivivens sp.]|uniref:glycoside hydrolase family protein n=1 Tax=Litorivivens sp. TaxID=2020868 RepID=UPI00356B33A5